MKLSFTICSYIFSKSYDKTVEAHLDQFMGEEYQELQTYNSRKNSLFHRMYELLLRQHQFYSQILAAEIYVHYHHNILKAKIIV